MRPCCTLWQSGTAYFHARLPRKPAHMADLNTPTFRTQPDTSTPEPVLWVVNLVLRHRVAIVSLALLGAVTVVGLGLLASRTYTSTASVAPARKGRPALSGLAAQLGVAIASTDADQSPQFYIDLIQSPYFLGSLADSPVELTGAAPSGATWAYVVQAPGKTPAERRVAAAKIIGASLHVASSARTGVISVEASQKSPALAAALAARVLAQLNEFNLKMRQSQATSERKFTEQRVSEVKQELRQAEDAVQAFLLRNASYASSPSLRFEFDRLSRAVTERQQVYTSLVQAYEQAKIDEVRDTPVLSVVAPPMTPVYPDPRGLFKKMLLALFAGAAIAVVFAALAERLQNRAATSEFTEFNVLRREALADLRNPLRPIARVFTRRNGA